MLLFVSGLVGTVGALYMFVKLKMPWLSGDLQYLKYGLRIVRKISQYTRNKTLPIDVFEETADKCPDKAMIIYKDMTYNFMEVDKMANKVAHMALSLGFKQGDTVTILMYNEPAFIWTWFGFQKIGVQVAFINYHQRKKVLLHSVTESGAKAVFLNKGSELCDAIDDVASNLGNVSVYAFEPSCEKATVIKSISSDMRLAADTRIPRHHRQNINEKSTNCFVFTSGTTGLPKPAIVSHLRVLNGLLVFDYCNAGEEDVLYETLPLYHSAASVIGLGTVIKQGVTMVLAEKFSSRTFFKECCHHNVTMIHYVGEMCRYLINTPKTSHDVSHKIRVAIGNGLRKDVWTEFQNRFHISKIMEFYGATEFPFGFINIFNTVGSIGKLSPLMRMIFPVELIKYDTDHDDIYRNDNGHCVCVGKNEPGLLVVKTDERIPFDGYTNREATRKKIIHDVFKKGDVYVSSGDLLYIDDDYFMYFYDRLGDTFRWKGENVSSLEVANIISELPFISDACVYGVLVAGCEGRAGMAAVSLVESESIPIHNIISNIEQQCIKHLAGYAIPRFLRFRKTLDITSTYKQIKTSLKKEGFDLDLIPGDENVYFFDVEQQKYCLLDTENELKIRNQQIYL